MLQGCASDTRGLFGGGNDYAAGVVSNTIDYVTIASTGNASNFGDLTVARGSVSAFSSSTRAVWAGGYTGSSRFNVMDYVTIATIGNATDFGDLSYDARGTAAASNSTRGLIAGGSAGAASYNNISYVTIASAGNASDFGDLSKQFFNFSATCDANPVQQPTSTLR